MVISYNNAKTAREEGVILPGIKGEEKKEVSVTENIICGKRNFYVFIYLWN